MRAHTGFKWGLVLAVLVANSAFAQINGAGSSFAKDLIGAWAVTYGPAVGGVKYDAAGSGAGVTRAKERSVDFGVTDVPLTAAALAQAQLRQLPLAASAVAIVVNLPELGDKPLRLSGGVLGDIYRGTVDNWNHPDIAVMNPGMALPNRPIVPIWRKDGSGQAYAVASFMARHNRQWRRTNTVDSRWSAGVGRGVEGSEMVKTVSSTNGAIGFAALGAVTGVKDLSIVHLRNIDQAFVAPSAQSIAETLARADWSLGEKGNNAVDLDASPGAGAYPITTATYALVPLATVAGRPSAAAFIAQAVASGDAQVVQSKFVPLPAKAKAVVSAAGKPAS
jgi:phosphate transport system substrate-binding protein